MGSRDYLPERIEVASGYFPLVRLAMISQCGFASTAAGNLLTEDDQWRKLELMAPEVRGD